MPLTQPDPILHAFAYSASGAYIAAIPDAPTGTGRASWQQGYPPLTFTPLGSGGTPPFGSDTNGILNAISANSQWLQQGLLYTFNSSLSTTLSGYPAGALIEAADYLTVWMSKAGSNTHNPATLANIGTYWFPAIGEATVGLARLFAVTGTANAIVLTSAIGAAPMGGGTAIEQAGFFTATADNTSTVTVAVDGASAVALHRNDGSALAAGDIVNGQLYQILYNGTNWQVTGLVASQVVNAGDTTSSTTKTITSSAIKMVGLGLVVTPSRTGNLVVTGTCVGSLIPGGVSMTARLAYGTGTPPATDDADTGTHVGGVYSLGSGIVSTYDAFVTRTTIITGLTVGTPYWLDFAASVTAGSLDLDNLELTATEF